VLVDRDLVARLEQVETVTSARLVAALVACCATGPVPDALPLGRGLLVVTGPRRYVNRAVGVTLDELGAADVAHLAQSYRARGLPAAVQLSSWAPAVTIAVLADAGFAPVWCRSVLATDPRVTGRTGRTGPDDRVQAIPVTSAALAQDAADVMAADAVEAGEDRSTSDEFMAADRATEGTTQLLAMLAGRPVGCGSLTVVGTVGRRTGWLGAAATVPQARRQGVQTALVRHRLALAAGAGCDLVGVTASVGSTSARVLQRCGFSLVQEQWVVQQG